MKKRHPSVSLKKQQGVVIVMALLIVALVTALSYAMLSRLERDTRRTTLMMRNTQAEFYAKGSLAWAIDTLRNNLKNAKREQVIDAIPIKSPVNTVNGFEITSVIYDMQGRFNVNNLTKAEAQNQFKRLIRLVDAKISHEEAQLITLAVKDWIMRDRVQNEYSTFYSQLPTPYRPARREMLSVSELRLIKGVKAALADALQPYVTALPGYTAVNVQTASPIVLAALSRTMTIDAARTIEALRKVKPFTSVKAFTELDIVKNHPIESEAITIRSHYFLVETTVTIENQRLVIYTLLERTGSQDKPSVNIKWQSKGIW